MTWRCEERLDARKAGARYSKGERRAYRIGYFNGLYGFNLGSGEWRENPNASAAGFWDGFGDRTGEEDAEEAEVY